MSLLKSFQRIFFQCTGLFIAMLLLIIPLVWLSISYPQYVQSIGNIISHNTPLFMAFRWLLILAFFLFWPSIIDRFGTRHHWPRDKTVFWRNQRLKITIWLVLFELVLCENILLTIFYLIEHL